jgi:hypothetical protein
LYTIRYEYFSSPSFSYGAFGYMSLGYIGANCPKWHHDFPFSNYCNTCHWASQVMGAWCYDACFFPCLLKYHVSERIYESKSLWSSRLNKYKYSSYITILLSLSFSQRAFNTAILACNRIYLLRSEFPAAHSLKLSSLISLY